MQGQQKNTKNWIIVLSIHYLINIYSINCERVVLLSMLNLRNVGWILFFASNFGIVIYFYLIFFSPWSLVVISISAFILFSIFLLLLVWYGFTYINTIDLMPLNNIEILDLEIDLLNNIICNNHINDEE